MKLNIFLIFLILVIISFVITLNIFFQQNYQKEMAEQFNRQQLIIAKTISSSISDDFEHLEEELKAFTRLIVDRGIGKKGLKRFVGDVFAEESENEGIGLRVIGKSGEIVYPSGLSMANATEYLAMVSNLKFQELLYIDQIANERKVKIVTPLRKGGRFIGAILVEINLDMFNRKLFSQIKSGERGYAWMMDGSGALVYHPTEPAMVGKNIYNADESCFQCHTSFKTEAMILKSPDVGFSSYVSPKGEDKLIAFSRVSVSHMSWIVCVSIPYSEVIKSIQKSMRFHSLLILSIFSLTVMGAVIIIITNRRRTKAEEKAMHLERQRALEHEIVHAKNYLENILENTQTVILVIDTDNNVRTVNSACEKMFGKAKADIVDKPFFDVFPFPGPVSREELAEAILAARYGKVQHIRDYPCDVNGGERKINIILSPFELHGAVSGVILSGIDVTEEANLKEKIREYAHELEQIVRERTKELQSEKEKLNAIVDSIEAGICIFDPDKKLIWTNRVMKGWLSVDREHDLTLDDIYTGKHSFESLRHAVVDNSVVQEVVHNDFGNRRGYFQVVSTPLVGVEGRSSILVLIQDLTEIKMAEEQMMQSEKLSALARLSAGVAHEIGNPLTSISSYVQILKEMDFDEFTREALETVSRHINRIATIVRQMSSFTKTKREEVQKQSVSSIVDATLQLVKYDKRMRNIEISEEIEDGIPDVNVDGDQLEQVFINIVLNAADAMPDGGELTIKAVRNQNNVDIEFKDTGKGIPPDQIEKIFDPFFTTKEKGTGLGLSVSYTIIRNFGGTILVSSPPEGGTIFIVRLPAYEG